MTQTPDTQPGHYYVSMIDGPRTALLAGPFKNDHPAALALVDRAAKLAAEVDPKAHFYAFGTARMPDDYTKPGVLNAALGVN